jgi:hypothetical protein
VNEVSRSNLKKIIFLAVASVLITVLVVLGYNWNAIAALYRPAPPVKQVMLNYSNRVYGFSLKFPQYWSDSEPNTLYGPPSHIVRFTAPDSEGPDIPTTITIVTNDPVTEPLPSNETVEGFTDKYEANLKLTANNYMRVDLTDTTISGLPAKVLSWSMGDNEDLMTDQAIFIYEGQVYIITYAALSEFHDQDYNGFELVTATLKFKQSSVPASPAVANN